MGPMDVVDKFEVDALFKELKVEELFGLKSIVDESFAEKFTEVIEKDMDFKEDFIGDVILDKALLKDLLNTFKTKKKSTTTTTTTTTTTRTTTTTALEKYVKTDVIKELIDEKIAAKFEILGDKISLDGKTYHLSF